MDTERVWLGFIASEIFNGCIQLNKDNCPACKNGIISPILHFHNAHNLYDITEKYFSIVTQNLDLKAIFEKFSAKILSMYGVTSNNELITIGGFFLKTINPKALYYGDYITAEIDGFVSDSFNKSCVDSTNSTSLLYNPESPSYEPIPTKKHSRKTKEEIIDANTIEETPKKKIAKKSLKTIKGDIPLNNIQSVYRMQ